MGRETKLGSNVFQFSSKTLPTFFEAVANKARTNLRGGYQLLSPSFVLRSFRNIIPLGVAEFNYYYAASLMINLYLGVYHNIFIDLISADTPQFADGYSFANFFDKLGNDIKKSIVTLSGNKLKGVRLSYDYESRTNSNLISILFLPVFGEQEPTLLMEVNLLKGSYPEILYDFWVYGFIFNSVCNNAGFKSLELKIHYDECDFPKVITLEKGMYANNAISTSTFPTVLTNAEREDIVELLMGEFDPDQFQDYVNSFPAFWRDMLCIHRVGRYMDDKSANWYAVRSYLIIGERMFRGGIRQDLIKRGLLTDRPGRTRGLVNVERRNKRRKRRAKTTSNT